MARSPVELVREGFARWNQGDGEGFFTENATPDCELHSRLAAIGGEVYRGRQGVRDWIAEIERNFERFELWLDDAWEFGDDRVAALGGVRARSREAAIEFEQPMGWTFDLEDGKVRRMLFYRTQAEAVAAAAAGERA